VISFDFEYHKPATIEQAVELHKSLRAQKKRPIYYTGGTEITTLGRLNQVKCGAVIDLKGIPECNILKLQDNQLVMGGGLSFTRLIESNLFPLLSLTIREVADHSARSNITLGGNICGQIIYREGVLPLLLTDTQVMFAGDTGINQLPIHQLFNRQIQLEEGQFLVQFTTDQSYLQLPYVSIKKRKQGSIGYPLVTVAALKKDGQIRIAFSGLSSFPFREQNIEQILNQQQVALEVRIDQAIRELPYPILDDVEGTSEYREFVLRNTMLDILTALENDGHE